MGFACPVCAVPQADGEHLAHHLAITALVHDDAHATWLDEHVPDWADRDPEAVAAAVTEHAESIDHETVFDDPIGGEDAGAPDVDGGELGRARGDPRALDPETRRAIEDARELTRPRRSGQEREE